MINQLIKVINLIYIYAFSKHFYPKRLTVHLGYTFLSVCVFPGNWTQNLLQNYKIEYFKECLDRFGTTRGWVNDDRFMHLTWVKHHLFCCGAAGGNTDRHKGCVRVHECCWYPPAEVWWSRPAGQTRSVLSSVLSLPEGNTNIKTITVADMHI